MPTRQREEAEVEGAERRHPWAVGVVGAAGHCHRLAHEQEVGAAEEERWRQPHLWREVEAEAGVERRRQQQHPSGAEEAAEERRRSRPKRRWRRGEILVQEEAEALCACWWGPEEAPFWL